MVKTVKELEEENERLRSQIEELEEEIEELKKENYKLEDKVMQYNPMHKMEE